MFLSDQTQQQVAALTTSTDAISGLFNSQGAAGTVFDSPILGNAQDNGAPHTYRLRVSGEEASALIQDALKVVAEQGEVSFHVSQVLEQISPVLNGLIRSTDGLESRDVVPTTSGRHSLSNSVRELSRLNRFMSDPEAFQYV